MTANSANHESDEPVNASPDPLIERVIERQDDDDYDLLTYGEAAARLTEEVAKQRHMIEQLRAGGAAFDLIEPAEHRLAMLRAAVERNRKPSLEEMRRSGFFRPVDGRLAQ